MKRSEHEHWAKIILRFLVRRVKEFQGGNKYISYGALAKAVAYPKPHTGSVFGRNIGSTLRAMADLLDGIDVDGAPVPFIQALVVRKDSKLPSDGFWEADGQYASLSVAEKKEIINEEHQRIFDFGNRWEAVLTQLNIESPN